MVSQKRFRTKKLFAPKGPSLAEPKYFLRNNEVHGGQPRERNTKTNFGNTLFQRSKKHRKRKQKNSKTGLKKTPNVSLKAPKNTLKNNIENTSKKHQKMTP